jgi:phospholipase/carboxylesterase
VDALRPSVAALLDLLDTWPRSSGLDGSSVDVAGFSQGAAMAFALALLHPARVRKLAVLAGFAPEAAEQVLAPGQFNGKKFFVAHGTKDETIPIAQARRTVQLMEQAGAQVAYCESNVGHKLGVDCLKALGVYLS